MSYSQLLLYGDGVVGSHNFMMTFGRVINFPEI